MTDPPPHNLEPPNLTPPEEQHIIFKAEKRRHATRWCNDARSGEDLGGPKKNQDKEKGKQNGQKHCTTRGGGRWCGDEVSSHNHCRTATWGRPKFGLKGGRRFEKLERGQRETVVSNHILICFSEYQVYLALLEFNFQ